MLGIRTHEGHQRTRCVGTGNRTPPSGLEVVPIPRGVQDVVKAGRGGAGELPATGRRGLNPLSVHLAVNATCGLELIPGHVRCRAGVAGGAVWAGRTHGSN
ncbi:hypothetical protein L226DRAFT_305280 [Lentinus tigrinus ALCF2SS1-7]|uniref:Uncharacterized protein n=1 Tax=Lentinus tigrinus ALCF2SS1-6 TaxID=1328759 RepID=A0A5C2RVJ5_9APHY|nr:hypothetical protein L227DRAFT_354771 [Lentinus tigrinus ALCF2SS1-6]RPD69205.1 hypothetical protein L226DRAFT_305280 [Lentinus tigrinus ALCF2SS1-7]